MTSKIQFAAIATIVLSLLRLQADEVEMQNGDRYFGKVLSMSADTVVLDSEILGKVNLPRKKVTNLALGVNAGALKTANATTVSANQPAVGPAPVLTDTNSELATELRGLGANTNFIAQIRQQMLSASPEAASNYDEMVGNLLAGKMNMDDLRRQAQTSADQLRQMKREMGPEAGASLDAYLEVLDNFLKETDPGNAAPAPQK